MEVDNEYNDDGSQLDSEEVDLSDLGDPVDLSKDLPLALGVPIDVNAKNCGTEEEK